MNIKSSSPPSMQMESLTVQKTSPEPHSNVQHSPEDAEDNKCPGWFFSGLLNCATLTVLRFSTHTLKMVHITALQPLAPLPSSS